MKKTWFALLLTMVVAVPLSAAGLAGFGLTYGLDLVKNDIPFLGESTTTYSGLGFNADIYVGQRLGFYAGGAFGLISGIATKFEGLDPVEQDMSGYTSEVFGNVLLGLGAFLPLGKFDVSGALGFGAAGYAYKYASGFFDPVGKLNAGPGAMVSLGLPVSSGVEATLGCRFIYGMIQFLDEDSTYLSNLSVTPALGVRMKLR